MSDYPVINLAAILGGIGDTFGSAIRRDRERSELAELGGLLESGDYAGAASRAFRAGRLGDGLRLLEFGEERNKLRRQEAADREAFGALDGFGGGGRTAAPVSGGGDSTMKGYQNAIAAIESAGSGGYKAIGPVTRGDRPYGKYQVMGANIPAWTRAALGRALSPQEFLADPAAQDATFNHQFGQYVRRYGPEGAAQAWIGGPGSVGKTGRRDVLGTSVGEYGQRFLAGLGRAAAPRMEGGFSEISGSAGDVPGLAEAMRGSGSPFYGTLDPAAVQPQSRERMALGEFYPETAPPMPPVRPSDAELAGDVPLPPARPADLVEGRSVAAPRVIPAPADVPRAPVSAAPGGYTPPGHRPAPPGTHWAIGPGEPLLLRDDMDARTAGFGNPLAALGALFGGPQAAVPAAPRIPQAAALTAAVPPAQPRAGGVQVAGPPQAAASRSMPALLSATPAEAQAVRDAAEKQRADIAAIPGAPASTPAALAPASTAPASDEIAALQNRIRNIDQVLARSGGLSADARARINALRASTQWQLEQAQGRMTRADAAEERRATREGARKDRASRGFSGQTAEREAWIKSQGMDPNDPKNRQFISTGRWPSEDVVVGEEEKARARAFGKATGEAQAAMPKIEADVGKALDTIDLIRKHPGLDYGTGVAGWAGSFIGGVPGTSQRSFIAAVKQAKGGAFLNAYQALRGTGAISEKEGEKAEQALARLDIAQSKEDFVAALNDFESIVRAGLNASRKSAGMPELPMPPRPQAAPPAQERAQAPKVAPRDPGQRSVGAIYDNGRGTRARWTGNGWEVVE